jgi:hypothetical protein
VRGDAQEPAGYDQGSMTNVDADDFNELVVTREVGLGMLFENVPGALETAQELQATLAERMAEGTFAFVPSPSRRRSAVGCSRIRRPMRP